MIHSSAPRDSLPVPAVAPVWFAEDAAVVLRFLNEYRSSADTFRAYRREAYRLLKWCSDGLRRGFRSLSRDDLDAYRHFLLAPPADWCGPPAPICTRGGNLNPRWRPLQGPLEADSVRQALTILDSMFKWMVEEGYLQKNPLSLMRRRDPTANLGNPERIAKATKSGKGRITAEHLTALEAAAESPREKWTLALLRYTGMRLSEVCKHDMGAFTQDFRSRWTLTVVGKRGKSRLIPVCDALLRELAAWRITLGHPPLPEGGDHHPLLQRGRGDTRRLTPRSVNLIVGRIAWRAGLPWVTPHRLRHHFTTALLNSGMNPRYVQMIAGHSRFETTAIYHDADEDDLAQQLHRFGGAL
ncbi:MAG: tyrosine-type recombinase/integrase [Sinobacteraceae bacterium]|nr:tyrosine-type recombinase/integrase [Nevskiaceae bacterium]